MKKHFILLMMAIPVLGLSSCMSIFSSTQQPITITGENGTKLYDAANNVKLAEIKEGGSTTFRYKKTYGNIQNIWGENNKYNSYNT